MSQCILHTWIGFAWKIRQKLVKWSPKIFNTVESKHADESERDILFKQNQSIHEMNHHHVQKSSSIRFTVLSRIHGILRTSHWKCMRFESIRLCWNIIYDSLLEVSTFSARMLHIKIITISSISFRSQADNTLSHSKCAPLIFQPVHSLLRCIAWTMQEVFIQSELNN